MDFTINFQDITKSVTFDPAKQKFHIICGQSEILTPELRVVGKSVEGLKYNDVRVIFKADPATGKPVVEPLFSMVRSVRMERHCDGYEAVSISYQLIASKLNTLEKEVAPGEVLVLVGDDLVDNRSFIMKVWNRLNPRTRALVNASAPK